MFILSYLFNSKLGICRQPLTRFISRHSFSPSFLCSYSLSKFNSVRHLNGSANHVNVFKQLENEYYHSYLAKNKKYCGTIAFVDYSPENFVLPDIDTILNDSFEDIPGVTLISYLHAALKHSHHSPAIYDDARFLKLCETLLSKVSALPEDHVINMLKVLIAWNQNKRNDCFYDMCRTADKVLLPRYKLWGFDRCLRIMDHFYRLQVLRFSETVWNCMKRIWRDPNRLTSAQAVHGMFLVNAHRTWHPSVHMYSLECYLHQAVYELGAEECAIMALAFFKTQHRIKNPNLLKLLYQKLMLRISNIDSIPLVAFLKVFRFCHYYHLKKEMRQLLDSLIDVVDKHSYICCTHIALLGTGMLVYNSQVCEKVARRFTEEISNIRMKDIERTILAFETFNYESKSGPDVYKVALRELIKRKDDVYEYARPFYSAVTYLSLKGYCNFDLVNFLLSEEVIKKAFRQKDLSKYTCHMSLLTISDSIKIDFPEYSGNFLNESLRKDLYLSQSWKIPVETSRKKPLAMYDKILFQAKSLLQEILGGSDFVHYTYVLPHLSRPDLVFRLNGGTPVKLPDDILSNNYIYPEIPSKTEDWYVATCLCGNTVIYETDDPIGITLTKLRHLRKLGYKILCINERAWINKSKDEQIRYLRQLLEESQHENQVI